MRRPRDERVVMRPTKPACTRRHSRVDRSNDPRGEEDDALAATPRVARSPLESADHAEQQSLLRDVMKHLPERQREALLLRFFEDLSVDDTASAMGCAPGTVKATVYQALRALRQRLSGSAKLT